MTDARHPPTVGIAGSVIVIAAIFLPFLLLSGDEVTGLSTYYGYGIAGPWAAAILALLSLIAFAAGREKRTDPVTVAGATLVFGLFTVLLALQWAIAVPADVVLQLGTETWLEYHRWAVVVASLLLVVSAGWYGRVLGVY